MDLSGQWTGDLSGTNRGQLLVHLSQKSDRIEGQIVLDDVEFGTTTIELEGKLNENTIIANLKSFLATAPGVPTKGRLIGNVDNEGKNIVGTWETDIGTNGQFNLVRTEKTVAKSPNQIIEATPGIQPASIRRWNIRTISIGSFLTSVEELREICHAFTQASQKALALQEQSLTGTTSQEQLKAWIARIPPPVIEVTAVDGTFIAINNVKDFDPSTLPSDTKAIHFLSYKQESYLPGNGVQIRLSNINGTDPLNPASMVQIHGSDTIWLKGTSADILDIFSNRKTNRLWLHKQTTGNLILYGLVFPLALWLLFRVSPLFPDRISNNAVLNFGLFIYLYIAFYYVFDKLLRYLRWAFPLYEIKFTKPHRRQKHRVIAGALFVGLVGTFLYDLLKFLIWNN